jgi:hypothetical protein
MNHRTGTNWLERHPKKIIFLLLLVTVIGMALLTEKILAYRAQPNVYYPGIKRYIKLREPRPLYSDIIVPPPATMDISDTLAKKGYEFRVDANGFIIPSKIHDDPQFTLVFIGGSTTECSYVGEKNRFPYLTGRLLEQKTGLRINSYNGGKGGNTSLHSLDVLLNKVIPLKPDLVIMMHNINDLSVLLYEKTYWTRNPYRSPLVEIKPTFKTAMKNLEDSFHIIRDLTLPHLSRQLVNLYNVTIGNRFPTDEFKQARNRKIKPDKALLVHEFEMNLQTFVNLCKARNITPGLMTMPSRLRDNPDKFIRESVQHTVGAGLGLNYETFKELFDLYNQAIRKVAAENGCVFIDLARKVPPQKALMCDIVHFNDRGSKYVSGVLAEGLTPVVDKLHGQHHKAPVP